MKTIKIELISKSSKDITRLSRLQKLVCKLFKITPEKKYELILNFKAENDPFRVGGIVRLELNGITLCITDSNRILSHNTYYLAQSITPLNYIPEIIGSELLYMGSAYIEQSNK